MNVLILCTGNSARSVLAEALFNHMPICRDKFKAYSAGSFPTGEVNPFVLELLEANDIPTEGLRSKSWDEFSTTDAPEMDFIITVCDQAADEQCPFWPGAPITGHWNVPDPAAAAGTDEDVRHAFKQTLATLRARIDLFASLPFEKLDHLSLHSHLADIGNVATSNEA